MNVSPRESPTAFGEGPVLRLILAIAIALAGATTLACNTAPLLQPDPLGGAGSLRANRSAVIKGIARRNWERVREEPGLLIARLTKGRHIAVVRIRYDAEQIAIRYEDSEALKCKATGDSCSKIHRAYNRWVAQLRKDIARQVTLSVLDQDVPPTQDPL